jgi:hypothetical protein
MIIEGGTDYADAIGQLLRMLGPGGPYYRYAKERTGVITPELTFPDGSDWLAEAKNLAAVLGQRLIQTKTGVWRVVDPGEWNSQLDEERHLAHELAVLMQEPHVDKMLAALSDEQWDEWKDWLRKRKPNLLAPPQSDRQD